VQLGWPARHPSVGLALLCGILVSACACTAGQPEPPRPTSPDPTPAATPVATPVAATAANPGASTASGGPSSPAPSPSPDALAGTGFTCVPADDRTLSWLRTRGAARPDLPASDVVMVEVGPGDDPHDEWWIVAARSYSDGWGAGREYNPLSFLTTVPSGAADEKWIFVGRALMAPAGSADWSAVSWTGQQLEHGRQAQGAALSCLDAAR
jgi:hypothetical protein